MTFFRETFVFYVNISKIYRKKAFPHVDGSLSAKINGTCLAGARCGLNLNN